MIEKPPDCGLKKAQGFVVQATNHAVLRVISAAMPGTCWAADPKSPMSPWSPMSPQPCSPTDVI